MSVRNSAVMEFLASMRLDPGDPENAETLKEARRLMSAGQQDVQSLVREVLKARQGRKKAQEICNTMAGQVEEMKDMIEGMVHKNAVLARFESLYGSNGDTRVVCRLGNQMEEFAIHPDVDPEALKRLKPWEFVRIHEKVVVGVLAEEPGLLDAAMGDVVGFKGYKCRESNMVRVARHGTDEAVVKLADPLRDLELDPHTRLILLRDDPRWAIAAMPGDLVECQFEVPIDRIDSNLDDLACMDSIKEEFMEKMILRIICTDLKEQFGLDPLRGAMLVSMKPGMGKTKLMGGVARWIHELGEQMGFDFVLYVVPPNATKSMWHGEDSKIVRDLWASIRARQAQPRDRALFQLVVLDEIESLGKRAERGQFTSSSADSDALESFLTELDGMVKGPASDNAPAHVLCVGMTNRPDRLDPALKRPGRFGDLKVNMPDIDLPGAAQIMAVYARGSQLPWQLDGEIKLNPEAEEIHDKILLPAVREIFDATVLRYATDNQQLINVTAGQIFAGVHYKEAMNRAKWRAATRAFYKNGLPAVSLQDVTESLVDGIIAEAEQLEADPDMLIRILNIKVPVARVDLIPREELTRFTYLRPPDSVTKELYHGNT